MWIPDILPDIPASMGSTAYWQSTPAREGKGFWLLSLRSENQLWSSHVPWSPPTLSFIPEPFSPVNNKAQSDFHPNLLCAFFRITFLKVRPPPSLLINRMGSISKGQDLFFFLWLSFFQSCILNKTCIPRHL